MKKIISLLAVLLALAYAAYFVKGHVARKPPPLPASLAAIECRPNSYLAPNRYDVAHIGTTAIFWPCIKPGKFKEDEKARIGLQLLGTVDPQGGTILFSRKVSEGYARTDYSLWADPAIAQFNVEASYSLENQIESEIPPGTPITVPTPAAFAASGATTTFVCKGERTEFEHCIAYARTRELFWTIRITYARAPVPQPDAAGEISQAYQLVADHIASQD